MYSSMNWMTRLLFIVPSYIETCIFQVNVSCTNFGTHDTNNKSVLVILHGRPLNLRTEMER